MLWKEQQVQIVMALVLIFARTLALEAVIVLASARARGDAIKHVKDIVTEPAISHQITIDIFY